MSTNITHSTGSITPEVLDGFDSARPARSIVHTILGRADPDITRRPSGMRTGTLSLVFATGAAAASAEAILRVPQTLTLSDSDVPQVAMTFVVAGGDITVALDRSTRGVWIVTVPFQEIAP